MDVNTTGGMREEKNYSLKHHNTFGIDARCRRFVEFESSNEVVSFVKESKLKTPYFVIGAGANVLFTKDYDGTILRSAIKGINLEPSIDGATMCVGSGENWDEIVSYAVENHLYGAENLSLIPGDVGASAVQNIGAYGVEAKDLISKVEAVDLSTGEIVVFSNADCHYGYRQSRFKNEWRGRYFITYVTFNFSSVFKPCLDYGNIRFYLEQKGIDKLTAEELRKAIIEIRRAKLPDPDVLGNGGSFFMNPIVDRRKFEELLTQYPSMPHYSVDAGHEKIPAGWMIEQCGWKGRSLGRASVYEKQALVLINLGGATGDEVLHLCQAVCEDVFKKFGVEIHPEVNIIG